MRSRARRLAVRILPPVVTDLVRAVRRRGRSDGESEWQYLPEGWPDRNEGAGWEHETVAATQARSWEALRQRVATPAPVTGTSGAGGVPEPGDYALHNTLMVFAYVFGLAALGTKRLRMLDWGCGVGQYRTLANALFPSIELEYHCLELAHLARQGRMLHADATFHADEGPAFARTYDLVMASGSLQYVPDWRAELRKIAAVCERYLYVTRLPMIERAPSFVVLQTPRRVGYETAYPGWLLNRGEFLGEAGSHDLRLVREFLIWERPSVPDAPEQADYRGFLFSRGSGVVGP